MQNFVLSKLQSEVALAGSLLGHCIFIIGGIPSSELQDKCSR